MVAQLKTSRWADLPTQEFTGYYTNAPGQSWFHASEDAHGITPMWVTFTGNAVTQVERARAAGLFLPERRYFVRWMAAVTTKGEIGPRPCATGSGIVGIQPRAGLQRFEITRSRLNRHFAIALPKAITSCARKRQFLARSSLSLTR